MSYAGPTRSSTAPSTPRGARRASSPTSAARPLPAPPADDTDWQQVAVFGAGLALGIALGAGIALLVAPQSGEEARTVIRRRALRARRDLGRTSRDAWDGVRDELHGLTASLRRRKARRAADRALRRELAREAAADAHDVG